VRGGGASGASGDCGGRLGGDGGGLSGEGGGVGVGVVVVGGEADDGGGDGGGGDDGTGAKMYETRQVVRMLSREGFAVQRRRMGQVRHLPTRNTPRVSGSAAGLRSGSTEGRPVAVCTRLRRSVRLSVSSRYWASCVKPAG
jgi:hypothetical protein